MAHTERQRQAQEVVRRLERLADDRTGIVSVVREPEPHCSSVAFADGTQAVLRVPDGTTRLEQLGRLGSRTTYLELVEPTFGHCWFRLRFRSVWGFELGVTAKVVRLGSSTIVSRRPPYWWRRPTDR
ncbi:MAG TPA: hypothetical protein VHB02_08735 [Acidimicrobiales bacterium]|nr:hypothetical protein [Acidimicrobiales bacterium]